MVVRVGPLAEYCAEDLKWISSTSFCRQFIGQLLGVI